MAQARWLAVSKVFSNLPSIVVNSASCLLMKEHVGLHQISLRFAIGDDHSSLCIVFWILLDLERTKHVMSRAQNHFLMTTGKLELKDRKTHLHIFQIFFDQT